MAQLSAEQTAWFSQLAALMGERELIKQRLEQHLVRTGRAADPQAREANPVAAETDRAAREGMVQNLVADRSEIGANVTYVGAHAVAAPEQVASAAANVAAKKTAEAAALLLVNNAKKLAGKSQAQKNYAAAQQKTAEAQVEESDVNNATAPAMALRNGPAITGMQDRVGRVRDASPAADPATREVVRAELAKSKAPLTGQALEDRITDTIKERTEEAFYKHIATPLLDKETPNPNGHSAADLRKRAKQRLVEIEIDQIISQEIENEIATTVDQTPAGDARIVHPMQRAKEVEEIVTATATKYGYTNLAHFISRHGAPRTTVDTGATTLPSGAAPAAVHDPVAAITTRTADDAAARVVTGVSPDHATPQGSTTNRTVSVTHPAGPNTTENIQIPNYATRGNNPAAASSQHASAKAALYMLDEAAAQEARAVRENPAAASHGLEVFTGQESIGSASLGARNLGSYGEPGGLGASYAVDETTLPGGNTHKFTKQSKGAALTPQTITERLNRLSKTADAASSKTTLLADRQHGGFTPMTMFTQSATVGASVNDKTTKATVPVASVAQRAELQERADQEADALQKAQTAATDAEAKAEASATARKTSKAQAETGLDNAFAHLLDPARTQAQTDCMALAETHAQDQAALLEAQTRAGAAAKALAGAEADAAAMMPRLQEAEQRADAAIMEAKGEREAAAAAVQRMAQVIAAAPAPVPPRLTEEKNRLDGILLEKGIALEQAGKQRALAAGARTGAANDLAVAAARQEMEKAATALAKAQDVVAKGGGGEAATQAASAAQTALAAAQAALAAARNTRDTDAKNMPLAPSDAAGSVKAEAEAEAAAAALAGAQTRSTASGAALGQRMTALTQGGDATKAAQGKAAIDAFVAAAVTSLNDEAAAQRARAAADRAGQDGEAKRALDTLVQGDSAVLAQEMVAEAAHWTLQPGEGAADFEARLRKHLAAKGLVQGGGGAVSLDTLIAKQADQAAAAFEAEREGDNKALADKKSALDTADGEVKDRQAALATAKTLRDTVTKAQDVVLDTARKNQSTLEQEAATLGTEAGTAQKAADEATAAALDAGTRQKTLEGTPSTAAADQQKAAETARRNATEKVSAIETMQGDVAQAQTDKAGADEKARDRAKQVQEAEALLDARQKEAAALADRVKALEEQVATADEDVAGNRKTLAKLAGEMAEVDDTLSRLLAAEPKDEAATETAIQAQMALKTRRTALEAERKTLNDGRGRLLEQTADLISQQDKHAPTLEGAAMAAEDARTRLEQARGAAKDAATRLSTLETALKAAPDELAMLEKQAGELERTAKEFRETELREAGEAAEAAAGKAQAATGLADDKAKLHGRKVQDAKTAAEAVVQEENNANDLKTSHDADVATGEAAVKEGEAKLKRVQKDHAEATIVTARRADERGLREKLGETNAARARAQVAAWQARALADATPTDAAAAGAAQEADRWLAASAAKAELAVAEAALADARQQADTSTRRRDKANTLAMKAAVSAPLAARTADQQKLDGAWTALNATLAKANQELQTRQMARDNAAAAAAALSP